jgi:PhzF family phenazine biosynthesis protein
VERKLRQFQIDAFATRAFEGNPAAIVPLDRWLADATMQAIAAENSLSETAFFDRLFPTRSTSSIQKRVFVTTRVLSSAG